MAQQPDINAILAALASSRTGGTPNPPPQPMAQTVANNGYPGAGNPTIGGITLPQPTNSGSLDLSSIKPVSSGNVSLADAIAKARGSAADRATRDDPRLAGRGSRRSRSRSRSPPRRDNYRDNYNPFRDERRDDARRGANGRERSASPNRGAFSPQAVRPFGRERTPPAAGTDNNTEIITVESSSVGLIIGKAGENLKRVERETGARVQFITGPDSNAPLRQCKVSGTPRQRADAKAEIFRVAEENPRSMNQGSRLPPVGVSDVHSPALREGEKSMQIMVPDRTVGLIIGRKGETIRDLQERSGCHVNIVGENKSIGGLRPVNLIGTLAAAAKAKELIHEIVQSDTSGPTNPMAAPPQMQDYGRAPAPAPYDPYAGAYDPSGGSKVNDMIIVPSEAVGMIIGKGGETIKDMQTSTGCKINVSPPSGPDINREIGLIGSRMAIESAKRAIWDKVGTVREKQGGLRAESMGAYGDPYSHQPAPYGQPPPGPMPPAQAMPPPMAPDHADPYAAYGGYQNYLAMWYAAIANQGGQGPPPGP